MPPRFADAGGHCLVLADEVAPAGGLNDSLMGKFHSMNDVGQGICQVDISPMIAAYFPVGQSFSETQKVIRKQHMGLLQKFKGMQDPAGGTKYVTRFSLLNGLFSEVYIVVDLNFEGRTEADMVLKKATAFLRGGNL